MTCREVLLIDDDERVREGVRLQLGRSGYRVREAGDGPSALEGLDRPPDVVICDIRMPGMSGVDVLARLQELFPRLPVIMLTGYVEVEQAVEVMKRGAFDYLTKPVRRKELLVAIEKALEWRDLVERNARLEEENRAYQRDLEKKVEERTKEALALREGLMHAERLSYLGETLASVSHELKGPLTVVLGFGDLLEESIACGNREEALDHARKVRAQARRMAAMLAQLNDFARKPVMERRPLGPRELVEEVLGLGEGHLLARAGIAVAREFAADLPRILGDRGLLQQVFVNLIRNACHAMAAGGKLSIGGAPAEGGGRVVFWFADEGDGIEPEHLERIFEPFFTTKPVGKGTGLGLAISRRIVEEHGGSIRVASQVGRGTRFEIELPAAPQAAAG